MRYHERSVVHGVRRRNGQLRDEFETGCRGTVEKNARGRIGAFDSFERPDHRMRRLADAVAVEVEPAIAAPPIAAAIDRPPRPGVAAAEHDIAPIAIELV